jgi:hypothetical protein
VAGVEAGQQDRTGDDDATLIDEVAIQSCQAKENPREKLKQGLFALPTRSDLS